MKHKLGYNTRQIGIATGLVLFLGLAFSLMLIAAPVQAALPPRPEPVPTAVSPQKDAVKGAQIKLMVSEPSKDAWTVVEWQDPTTEEWTAVGGWQGTLDADGSQVWWVGRDHFGAGPFRWLVYDGMGGTLLETSDPFTLPTQDLQVVIVPVPAVEE